MRRGLIGLLIAGSVFGGLAAGVGHGELSLALVIGGALLALCLFRSEWLAGCLTIASMVTRPAIEAGGVSLRFEIALAFLALSTLILGKNRGLGFGPMMAVATAWLGLLAASSVLSSPDARASLATLTWLALSLTAAMWLALNPGVARLALRVGLISSSALAVAAIALWLVNLGIESFHLGLQTDPTYGGKAAYVLSIEANILAGLLVLWNLLAHGLGHMVGWSGRRWLHTALVVPAVLATHTRTALMALALGLLVLHVRSLGRAIVSVAALVVSAGVVSYVAGSLPGLSKFWGGLTLSEGTGAVRVHSWELALRQSIESPTALLFGHGFNSFGQRNLDPTRPDLFIPSYLGNLPLQLLYDGGLVGVCLAGALLILGVHRLVSRQSTRLVAAFLLTYVVLSVSTSFLWLLEGWWIAALLYACVARTASETPTSAVPVENLKR
jgi:hypothetical protein